MTQQRRTSTDEVVRELERRIDSSELTAHVKLPSEAALAIEFAVSRTVIRESLGYLRERGYLYTINGRGTFVRYPDAQTMSTVIERHLRFSHNNITVANLYEARALIEVAAARLAAKRASADDMAALADYLAEMQRGAGDPQRYAAADMGFHVRIAQASGNPMLPGLLAPMARTIITGMVHTHSEPEGVPAGLAMHAQILDRLLAGDADGAAEAMAEHLRQSESIFPATILSLVGDPAQSRLPPFT
jgi:GntR family transcriptional regulator, transcriptional repressor for pyruvate dehydrogenase complex